MEYVVQCHVTIQKLVAGFSATTAGRGRPALAGSAAGRLDAFSAAGVVTAACGVGDMLVERAARALGEAAASAVYTAVASIVYNIPSVADTCERINCFLNNLNHHLDLALFPSASVVERSHPDSDVPQS